jgi:hypothetical protein
MKRGIIEITKSELNELVNQFPMELIKHSQLEVKIISAIESSKQYLDTDPIRLQISEEELETLLDEIGVVSEDDSEAMKSLRKTMQSRIQEMRRE